MSSCAIGIDIHKASLVVAVHGGPQWTVKQGAGPLAHLVERLGSLGPTVIVLEPSGGYEQPVLAAFGTTMQPPLTVAPSPARARLAVLTGRRRQLRETAAAERRRAHTADPEAQASITRHLAFLEAEITGLEQTIVAVVRDDPQLARARASLGSVPGIGLVTAHLLLAELPDLGTVDPKALASLVGVAPFTRQSGASPGTAQIEGGRRHVRTGLWMPTLCAMTRNPVIRAFRERLDAQHKPSKVVTIACLRKLLTILNAMLARDELWSPRLQPA